MLTKKQWPLIILCWFVAVSFDCSKKTGGTNNTPGTPNPGTNDVDFWLTKSDQSVLLMASDIH
jgi:hypothetical protein